MPEAASYAAVEVLRDGTRAEIRALRPDDRAAILAAVDHTSERSLYRRFFAARRSFSEREIAFFLNIDFARHAALVAVVRPGDGGEEIDLDCLVAPRDGAAGVYGVRIECDGFITVLRRQQ